jgi:LuxR family maltose regulon positive regulatory protein
MEKAVLSARELEILQEMTNAFTNKNIADALGISGETVKWHVKNIYAKLGVDSRAGAVARSRQLGLLR